MPLMSLNAGDDGRYPGRLSRVGYLYGDRGLWYGCSFPRKLVIDL